MLILKVLKRKDGSSVVVAVVLAFLLLTLLTSWSVELTSNISDTSGLFGSNGYGGGWKNTYLNPAISTGVQIVILEALLWVWVGLKVLTGSVVKNNKSLKTKSKK